MRHQPRHHQLVRPPTAGTGTRSLAGTLVGVALGVLLLAAAPGRAGAAGAVWTWPLGGPASVVRGFAPPPEPWLPGHRGVDLLGRPGDAVRAAGAGRVSFAGRVGGKPVVVIAHAGGLRTTYEPVVPAVQVGDRVAAGDGLGGLSAGGSHCAPHTCLHWGLRRGDIYLDPLALLGTRPQVRLLPVWDVRLAVAGPVASGPVASGPGAGRLDQRGPHWPRSGRDLGALARGDLGASRAEVLGPARRGALNRAIAEGLRRGG